VDSVLYPAPGAGSARLCCVTGRAAIWNASESSGWRFCGTLSHIPSWADPLSAPDRRRGDGSGNNLFGIFFYIFTGLFPPIAIGVAVLRHRLWDIDIIIHRTLVYSILTVSLTVVFFGSVALLQSLFTTVIGHQSPAAIMLSTLAIVLLFTPLRRGIQERIDHRFYRHKYDAEQVLADFGTTLRDEADLESLTNSILGVIEETMQPTHLSLWLRKADSPLRDHQ
jgi:hypothetical protein